MRTFTVSSRDQNCRYLAHPASSIVTSQFVTRLESFGIRIPSRAWLEGAISRRWITPRIRIPLPSEALLSWTNFPTHTRVGAETCPLEHEWGPGCR